MIPILKYSHEVQVSFTIRAIYKILHHGTSWHRLGNSGNSDRLYILGLKITADGDCSHKIKRRLLLGRKVMTNLDSILPTKIHLVKAMVFPVVMYGCELDYKES